MRVAVVPVLLACCAVEAATALHHPPAVDGITWVLDDGARDVTVVVLAGTITLAQRPHIESMIADIPTPRAVVAFGVCAASGGPYWDSDVVVPGWAQADRLLPGCPPPAEMLWQSVMDAALAVTHAAH